MKVGYYQFRPLFGKVEKNLNKIINAIGRADVDTDLIVLPELALTGYYFKDRNQLKSLAEDPANSSRIDSLIKLCKKNDLHLVMGFAELAGSKVYNSSILIGPNGTEHIYRKLHLFNEEKNIFDQGDIPLSIQSVKGVKIGMMVCFDWVFPEVMRSLTLLGAEIICHPSNLVLAFCQEAMVTRCLENRVFAVTSNRYGVDKRPQGKIKFTGKSQIIAPGGRLINRAASQREQLFIADIDHTDAQNKSITPFNDLLSDRRPDCYDALLISDRIQE
ncbi:MAG: nitrilase-related carbon-nitrogen hydrolase [Gammaproteobacteria bacterium]